MDKNDVLYIDLQYYASVNWYKKVVQYKYIEYFESDQHVKMSFRNRLWLSGADGLLSLSIPLVAARNENQLYKDVRIAPARWAISHFRTISSCYNRSPWFEYYRDELAALYASPFRYLWDWNLACFDWVNKKLISPIEVYPSGATRRVDLDRTNADARNLFRPGNREEWLVGDQGRYAQVFEDRTGFIPGLSILDLLFCEGPAASKWLGQI